MPSYETSPYSSPAPYVVLIPSPRRPTSGSLEVTFDGEYEYTIPLSAFNAGSGDLIVTATVSGPALPIGTGAGGVARLWSHLRIHPG